MIAIKTIHVIAKRRTKMLEVSMLEWMTDVVSLIIRPIMPVPMIVVYVWNAVNAPALASFNFGPRAGRPVRWSRLGNSSSITMNLMMFLPALRECRRGRTKSQSQ
jgi:hypothetical protein